MAKPEQQLAGMRRETNTESHDSVLGVPRKFHATITDEQALKLKLVMVQDHGAEGGGIGGETPGK